MDQSELLTLLVVRGAALVLAVVLVRLAVAFTLTAVARTVADPARARALGAVAVRVGPRLSRGLVVAALGVSIGVGGATAAVAGPAPHPGDHPTGVPVLDRVVLVAPAATAAPTPKPAPPSRRTSTPPNTHATHVVRSGDSLWSIARSTLGRGASDQEVASNWPRWYSANRAVIGADPDRLRPGQVLRAPGAERSR